MGAELLVWLGRCSSFVFFAAGGSEVAPPVTPPPPPFQNILGGIFLSVAAMIFWAMADIIGAYLRLISDDRRSGSVDPTKLNQYAKSIFETFGMAITQIVNIGKTIIKS